MSNIKVDKLQTQDFVWMLFHFEYLQTLNAHVYLTIWFDLTIYIEWSRTVGVQEKSKLPLRYKSIFHD